jgi:aldose sugar dehydrogenase
MKYFLFFLIVTVLAAACKPAKDGTKNSSAFNAVGKDTVSGNLVLAQKNYVNYCGSCHGEKMDAFVDRKWKHGKSTNSIFRSIKNGIENDGMPAYRQTFSKEEIKGLVAYIKDGIANREKYDFKDDRLTTNIVKTDDYTIRLDTVVYGIEVPWGMAFLKDGSLLYTERKGTLTLLKPDKTKTEIKGVPPVKNKGQGGLLDVELHPGFEQNNIIYLSYSKQKNEDGKELGTTAVIMAKLIANELMDVKEIFEATPYVEANHHYGSRLEFDNKGYLYISVGDRGNQNEHPQFLTNACGKIHRIKDDGSVPDDNPFVATPGAIKTIYSYGQRNPQGLAFNPADNKLWENEHGPRGGDEINIIEPGHNYGWPTISYGINYNGTTFTNKTAMDSMDQPIVYWLPSIGPSGMVFVKGNRYPAWQGNIMSGSLRFKYLQRSVVQGNKIIKEEPILKKVGRLRDVQMGQDGYLYIATENPGAIYKLVPVQQ